MHGDGRNYCTALVTLDPDALTQWAEHRGVTGDYAELSQHPDVHAEVAKAINESTAGSTAGRRSRTSGSSSTTSRIEAGELTPSLKVKRRVVEDKHRDLLDAMYASG